MRNVQELLKKASKILITLWLLFPSLIFLILVWQCFWVLPQGKDIIISMLENRYVAAVFLVALIFFVFITWYTGRILVYRKRVLSDILYKHYKSEADKPEGSQKDVAFYLQIVFNMPRLFGYLIFVFIWIAFLRLTPLPELGFTTRISSGWAYGLFFINILIYIGLYRVARIIRKRAIEQPVGHYASALEQKKKKNLLFGGYFVLLLLMIVANLIWHNAWLLLLSIVLLQMLFPFIVVIRRTRSDLGALPMMEGQNYLEWLQKENIKKSALHWIMYHTNIPLSEKRFFLWFNLVSVVGLIFYLLTVFHFPFSVWLGSFSFVLLAFGVLIGFFSIISIISVANQINLHIFIFMLAIVVGAIPGFEPHYANLTKTSDPTSAPFKSRPDLKTYFSQWVALRQSAIEASTEYPVYFILADGGASRSGYWTASALSKLQDSTKGKFGNHLFCLSGASGGSVGNGSFFALLHQEKLGSPIVNYGLESRNYLQEDFLTYTLGRMLGPDFVRFILPIWFIDDRAAALEHAMENGGTGDYRLASKMKMDMSDLIPFQQNNKDIPILFVNVTRMQDGRPGLISNIKLDESSFGKRLDVLNTLDTGKNMKLSTAVIMGARFPYISPAGRINNSYYVDGGYFDNSGAGAVHEMIIQLNRLVNDPATVANQPFIKKLRFTVIHVMNSPEGDPIIKKVHPLQNDLMAPLLTLIGSYSTQTTVNNLRLVKYIEDITGSKNRYIKINLYEQRGEDFPMNWTISQHYRRKMDVRLEQNNGVKRVLTELVQQKE